MSLINYYIVFVLIVAGLYGVLSSSHLLRKIIGLNVFQSAVFLLFISMGKVKGGSAPILKEGIEVYSNPLPHVLILTAIVVSVATTTLALALAIRIKQAYGTVEEVELRNRVSDD